MSKKSLLLGLLLAVLILPGLTAPCAAQDGNSEADIYAEFQDRMSAQQNTRDSSIVSTSATIAQMMEVPYNIMDKHWITGLNFHCWEENERLTFLYVNKGETYHKITVGFNGSLHDVTKVVNDEFLMQGESFKSPTTLLIASEKGAFTVSQFLMNDNGGFGFQTFFSY